MAIALTIGLVGLAQVQASADEPLSPAVTTASIAAQAISAGPSARGDIDPAVQVPKLAWATCTKPGREAFECATARVPMNYAKPQGRKITLAVIRLRATDQTHRIGSLFFNPGGPGGPGVEGLAQIAGFFPTQLRNRFDLVSWDPRGVGESTSVQCFASEAAEARFRSSVSLIPVGKNQEQQLIKNNAELGRKCARRSGDLLRFVSTADTARDLDLLRAAVGDRKLNYYGISYGTFLGATYANLFPKRVRALVLDGDVNPQAWVTGQPTAKGRMLGTFLRQKSDTGSAKTLNAFLNLCGRATTDRCAFSAGSAADTRSKFATMIKSMRRHSLQTRGGYTYAQVIDKAANDIYFTGLWSHLAQALQDVWLDHAVTRAEPLLGQKYAGIGQQLSIMCGESPNPPASTFAWQSSFATDRSGTTGPYWSWIPSGCASWPATAALRYVGPWNKRTAKPILVMSTTFDPATPYQGAQFMTKTLARARLLTVDGYGHTALFNTSTCANDYSSRYFIEGRLPRVGTRCAQDFVPFASGS